MRLERPMIAVFGLAGLALSSCGPSSSSNDSIASDASGVPNAVSNAAEAIAPTDQPEGNSAAPNSAATASQSTTGGDGSEIILNPLSPADIKEAKLEGELACSFDSDGKMLMLARGNVGSADRAWGVVKVAGYVERIGAPGGFDAMSKGTRFDGQGKTVHVAVTGEGRGDGESPPRAATLTYDRADGARRTWNGDWTCGP